MSHTKRKTLTIRIPPKYKTIFVKYRDKIPELIDLVYSEIFQLKELKIWIFMMKEYQLQLMNFIMKNY